MFISLADRIVRAHRFILFCAVLLTAASLILITQLKADFSLDSLMPLSDRRAKNILEDLRDAGAQDILVALVSVREPGLLDDGKHVVDELVRRMASFPDIGHIEARVTAQQERFFTDVLMPHAALFLSGKQRHELLQRISDKGIHRQVQENKRLLMMPMQRAAGELILRDPLGLRTLLLSRWFKEQTFSGLTVEDGYLVDENRRHLLIFIRPKESAHNMKYTKRLMAAASAAAEAAVSAWRRSHPDAKDSPTITFAGGYPLALEDEALTRRDMQTNLIFSLLGVSLLFFMVFRRVRLMFLILIPLAMAVIWTFGLLRIIFGHVNILTGAFAGVLLGLGIDFAIHIINLYLAACRSQSHVNALRVALAKSGRGILIGGLTTASAFLALGVSSFRGFQELGIITGVGMLACLAAMLVVLPALLIWQQGGGEATGLARPIPNFGLESLTRAVLAHPRLVVAASLCVLTILGVSAFGVSFEEDLRALRPQQAAHLAKQEQVESLLGGASGCLLLVMEDSSDDVLLNRAWHLSSALDRLQAAGRISHYRSALSYRPAPESQRQALEFFRRHSGDFDPERIEATFRQALQDNGFQFLPEYGSYLRWLRTMVRPSGMLDLRVFQQADLTRLLDPFLVSCGSGRKLFTFIYPLAGLWRKADVERLTLDLQQAATESGLAPNQWRLAGLPVLTDYLKGLIWHDLGESLILACLAIAATLLFAFRRPLPAAMASIPLAGGILAMLGIMALASLPFNYANFIVLPVIIGIGIDDGVHIVSRWHKEPAQNLPVVLRQMGRAVVLTSLTTMIAFGSLVTSHCTGLRSIGWATALGILTCMIASLVLLPAVLAWMGKK
ncbi:MAG: MMPL family transporter [Desulfobacterales bacterium]|nr:MMPL family transporter [Desulfobacterales bacterium]